MRDGGGSAISSSRWAVLTAVENGGAGAVSRRSKMAAHNRAVPWKGRIGAIAAILPPCRKSRRSAQRVAALPAAGSAACAVSGAMHNGEGGDPCFGGPKNLGMCGRRCIEPPPASSIKRCQQRCPALIAGCLCAGRTVTAVRNVPPEFPQTKDLRRASANADQMERFRYGPHLPRQRIPAVGCPSWENSPHGRWRI